MTTALPSSAPATSNSTGSGYWSCSRLLTSTFKDLGPPRAVGLRFKSFLLSSDCCLRSMLDLLHAKPDIVKDFSLEVDAFELTNFDPVLGNMLLRYPATLLGLLEDAIVEAQREVKARVDSSARPAVDRGPMIVKGEGGAGGMTRIHARLVHLPPHFNCCKPSISSIVASDANKIIQVGGTVVRTSSVQMYESVRAYKCREKNCGHQFCVYADLEQSNNALPVPTVCPGVGSTDGAPCTSNKFDVLEGQSVHSDYQEIKIQESSSGVGGGGARVGTVPRSLLIKLQHDLVDRCQPGDEIVAVGSLIPQWQPVTGNLNCEIGIALNAHSIRIVNSEDHATWDAGVGVVSRTKGDGTGAVRGDLEKEFDDLWDSEAAKARPIATRNFICGAVCPKLYGVYIVKLALLATLIGGVSADAKSEASNSKGGGSGRRREPIVVDGQIVEEEDEYNDEPEQFNVQAGSQTSAGTQLTYGFGQQQTQDTPPKKKGSSSSSVHTRRRDQSHMLLVGDPGTGKSQFLRFAAALCPRSVMTTGTGTTSAGLTCAAVREGKRGDFALEAGALVLADKGVCCIDEFGCIRADERTTIHEAMEQQTLSVAKAGIVCKLNCRATIIAVTNAKSGLYDHDQSLSANTGIGAPLLSRFDLIFKLVDDSDGQRDGNIATFLLDNAILGSGYKCSNAASTESHWNIEKLRAYIATVKARFHPSVSRDAGILLERHYQECRRSEHSTSTVTVRFLESLIRLSQAHARLMFRDIVTLQDATAAVLLMECSAWTLHGDKPPFSFESCLFREPLSTQFPDDEDADASFLCDQYTLLERYGMLDRLTEDDRNSVLSRRPSEPLPTSREWDNYGNTVNQYVSGNFVNRTGHATPETDHYGRSQLTQSHRKLPSQNRGEVPNQGTFVQDAIEDPDDVCLRRLERHASQVDRDPSPSRWENAGLPVEGASQERGGEASRRKKRRRRVD